MTQIFNLENSIGKVIKTISAGTTDYDLLAYATAIKLLNNGLVKTVSSFSSLPAASTGNQGEVYFITDVYQTLYYSTGVEWVPLSDGTIKRVLTWGSNSNDTLGSGSGQTSRSSPGTITGDSLSWDSVVMGNSHVLALNNGQIFSWGDSSNGALGNDCGTGSVNTPTKVVEPNQCWKLISANGNISGGIKTDGTLWTWGQGSSGALGAGFTIAVRSSPGTVQGGGTTWCQLSVGWYTSGAIKTDGTLWMFGCNWCGQLGDNTQNDKCSPVTTAGAGNNWCQVFSNRWNVGGIKTNGTLWTWGHNGLGQLGDNTTTNRSSPGSVAGGGNNWCSITFSSQHVAALKTDGTIWTWGRNEAGQLGNNCSGIANWTCSPGTVAGGGTTWCQTSIGGDSSSGIKTDGTLWTWGCNQFGRLGTNNTTDRSSPGTVIGCASFWRCVNIHGGSTTIALTVENY